MGVDFKTVDDFDEDRVVCLYMTKTPRTSELWDLLLFCLGVSDDVKLKCKSRNGGKYIEDTSFLNPQNTTMLSKERVLLLTIAGRRISTVRIRRERSEHNSIVESLPKRAPNIKPTIITWNSRSMPTDSTIWRTNIVNMCTNLMWGFEWTVCVFFQALSFGLSKKRQRQRIITEMKWVPWNEYTSRKVKYFCIRAFCCNFLYNFPWLAPFTCFTLVLFSIYL